MLSIIKTCPLSIINTHIYVGVSAVLRLNPFKGFSFVPLFLITTAI